MANDIRASDMLITPEIALEWLERMGGTNYRPLDEAYVKHLVEQIKLNRWEFNGETIKLNANGVPVDGQHRLWACVIAEKPIRTMVIFGVDSVREADRGRPRTLGHELRSRGEKNATLLASLLTRVCTHEHIGIGSRGTKRHRVSVTEAMDALRRYPDTRGATNFRPQPRIVSSGNSVFFKWLFDRIDRKDSDVFFSDLYDGVDLKAGDPMILLRKSLTTAIANKSRPIPVAVEAAYIAKTWSARREGRSIGFLHWRRYGDGAEDFPDISGDTICRSLSKPRASLKLDQRIAEVMKKTRVEKAVA